MVFLCRHLRQLIDGLKALIFDIEPRLHSRPVCPKCGKRRNVFDRQPRRLFGYLPISTFKNYFRYAPRQVSCSTFGVKVEVLPWGMARRGCLSPTKFFWSTGQSGFLGRRPPTSSRPVETRSSGPSSSRCSGWENCSNSTWPCQSLPASRGLPALL